MNKNLIANAQLYATRRELEIAERLGSGKDGTVFVAQRKLASAKVAIKAHRFGENYWREKLAYERLRRLQISSIEGFNVPCMTEPTVLKILDAFEELGIYLTDVSPANIAFAD